MAQIGKTVRRYAIDLLTACAFECAEQNRFVMIAEISPAFLDGELDLYERDRVELIAALTFRSTSVSTDELYPQVFIETYLEAAERLREGFNPDIDNA